MQKALIVKLAAIGDTVMALPSARALRERGYDITWICGKTVLPLLECYSWLELVVVDEHKLLQGGVGQALPELIRVWSSLFARRFDLVAVLQYDWRYRLLTLPVRAGRKISLRAGDRCRSLLAERHHSDEYFRVMCEHEYGPLPGALIPEVPDRLPDRKVLATPTRRRVALAPCGARNVLREEGLRRWPVSHYVELARRLLSQEIEVVVTGGASDAWAVSEFRGLEIIDLIGNSTLPELIQIFDECDVVVTHDTGALHIAGLTRSAIVALFGPTNPWGRLPRRTNAVAIWGGEGFACRPCYDGHAYANCASNDCMSSITPAFVEQQVLKALDSRAKQAGTPALVLLHRTDGQLVSRP